MPAHPGAVDNDRLELPAAARSVPLARRWVAERLGGGATLELRDAAELLTTEVVTNAVLHAGTPVTVTVATTATGVRVSVTDGSGVPVARRPPPGPTATTGRGSLLLDALAARWGSTVGVHDKVVWFELDLGQALDGGARQEQELHDVG